MGNWNCYHFIIVKRKFGGNCFIVGVFISFINNLFKK